MITKLVPLEGIRDYSRRGMTRRVPWRAPSVMQINTLRYLLSSTERIWPAMDLSETSAYSTFAFRPSISVQGLRSPLGVKFKALNSICLKSLRYKSTAGALPDGSTLRVRMAGYVQCTL